VTALLDVNLLLAMLSPRHSFFRQAGGWFAKNHRSGWASCPLRQAGFVRLYTQRAVTGIDISAQEAMDVLGKNCTPSFHHVFWPQEFSLLALLPEIRRHLIGHKQLIDAILLDLAIRKGGRLVTMDQRVHNLLPPGSPHRSAIEVIPL
jgi:toxin-antitoxin system PIN domain toxin